jgi:IclR family transcriptional regulator, acetate operon repressor
MAEAHIVPETPGAAPAGTPYGIRAALRLLDILDFLQDAPDGSALQPLADAVGLHKSTTFRYLSTLAARGYVEHDRATGVYRLGRAFMPSRPLRLEVLAARARPLLATLRDRFGETCNLGMLDGNRVAYIEIMESPKAMRLAARKGDRDPIHSTALGKAIAARLPTEQVRAILAAEGMPRRTSRTITSLDAFLRELDLVREQGFATDNGENEEDGRCVAVPVPDSRIPVAISLSAPAPRFALDRVEEVAAVLRATAERLAAELGGHHA